MTAGGTAARTSARQLLKRLVFGASLVVVSPMILAAWIEDKVIKGDTVFVFLTQLLALIPGAVGTHLRGAYYYGTLEQCSWQVHVGFGSVFTHRGASVGPYVSIGMYCVIGHARIGDHVVMASRISIPSGRRQHLDGSGKLSSQPRFESVTVGRGSWIGEGAIIMANVGERCIVSAGTVIINEMPGASLLAGNPAAVVRALNAGT
jgi:acetyltransferase-like isoleucine patch superfamily enzyme